MRLRRGSMSPIQPEGLSFASDNLILEKHNRMKKFYGKNNVFCMNKKIIALYNIYLYLHLFPQNQPRLLLERICQPLKKAVIIWTGQVTKCGAKRGVEVAWCQG